MRNSPDAHAGRGLLAMIDNQPYVLLTLTMLLWSGNLIVGRAVVDHIPPVALAQIRWALAFVLILPLARRHLRTDWAEIRAHWPMLFLFGILGIGAYNTLLYIGVHHTTAVNAAVLSSTFPVMIAAAGFVLFRDRLTLAQAFGILISCLGALVVLSKGDLAALRNFHFAVGDLWILTAQVAYAAYTVLLRKRPAIHPVSLLTVTIFFGTIALIPFALLEAAGGAHVPFDLTMVGAALYVAIFPSLIAFFCFNRGVALVGSNRASPFFHLVPVFGSLMAVFFLGESIGAHHAIGWLLILTGIAAAQLGKRVGATARAS
ncbi:DMT family transporter [Acuticoccus kandeliae]|uniref:DMT family transporter n=1 Tax=Acuticoccus kandeliae TaxID=2073160 RepID=UPI000D3E95F0|nr:DMT family transporter [Acuticoccus kandeliae]